VPLYPKVCFVILRMTLFWLLMLREIYVNVANKICYVTLLHKSQILCLRTTLLPSEILLLLLLLLLLLFIAFEFSLGGSSPYTSNK